MEINNQLIIKDLNKRKYECRKVSPSDARTVTSDWKLIALRIGKSKTQGLGAENYQDYHVMRRTAYGRFCSPATLNHSTVKKRYPL